MSWTDFACACVRLKHLFSRYAIVESVLFLLYIPCKSLIIIFVSFLCSLVCEWVSSNSVCRQYCCCCCSYTHFPCNFVHESTFASFLFCSLPFGVFVKRTILPYFCMYFAPIWMLTVFLSLLSLDVCKVSLHTAVLCFKWLLLFSHWNCSPHELCRPT